MDDKNMKKLSICSKLLDDKNTKEQVDDISSQIPSNSGDFEEISNFDIYDSISTERADSHSTSKSTLRHAENEKIFPQLLSEQLRWVCTKDEEQLKSNSELIPSNSAGGFEGLTSTPNIDYLKCTGIANSAQISKNNVKKGDPCFIKIIEGAILPSNCNIRIIPYSDSSVNKTSTKAILRDKVNSRSKELLPPKQPLPSNTPEATDEKSGKKKLIANDSGQACSYLQSESGTSRSKHVASCSRSMRKDSRRVSISHPYNSETKASDTTADEPNTCGAQHLALLESMSPQSDFPKNLDLSVRRKTMKIGSEKSKKGKKGQSQKVADGCCTIKDEIISELANKLSNLERKNKYLKLKKGDLVEEINNQKNNSARHLQKK